ncbi:lysophosphatidylserine lipase ABHD12 isoform X2 [Lepisosteus oculatus]|uniref:lysophosphatidylserine lipase ABHD12 isoform X2 n=1 Tax=Lepisosteus oculatus TaxID=7918 RepID=UPI0007401FD1|nr:PREDICTED: abhydrolase domain-containing protein 12B isoform X2 [Lepisosteus oculatus]
MCNQESEASCKTLRMRKRKRHGFESKPFARKTEKGTETEQLMSGGSWSVRVKTLFIALLVVYISVPVTLRLFPGLLAQIVFFHFFKVPFFVDLECPADLSLNHTVNFYLTPEDGVTVGVWHTVPDSQWEQAQGKGLPWYEASLGDDAPVIIYLHGNGGTRAVSHRVGLIKMLSAAGFHVLVLEYRGFGDSTGQPSEDGLTTDALQLYHWVKAHSRGSPVCLWGHSLGTGVATNVARKLQEQGNPADGVILEAPYTNIREEVAYHPLGLIYWLFPGFEYFFLDTIALNNLVFPNDENLKTISSPLMILHAEDDQVVPFHMSQELHKIVLQSRSSKDEVRMCSFSGSLGYGHNKIFKDPDLPSVLWEFLQPLAQRPA